jgi:hypothetical protein
MPTNESGNNYISILGVYLIYRRLQKEGKILKGTRAYDRMKYLLEGIAKDKIKKSDVIIL